MEKINVSQRNPNQPPFQVMRNFRKIQAGARIERSIRVKKIAKPFQLSKKLIVISDNSSDNVI